MSLLYVPITDIIVKVPASEVLGKKLEYNSVVCLYELPEADYQSIRESCPDYRYGDPNQHAKDHVVELWEFNHDLPNNKDGYLDDMYDWAADDDGGGYTIYGMLRDPRGTQIDYQENRDQ